MWQLVICCIFLLLIVFIVYKYKENESCVRTLDGKHVVITGGSSGIGKAAAIEAAKSGAHVTIIGRNENRLQSALEEIRKSVKETNQKVTSLSLDVCQNYDVIEKEMEKLEKDIGPTFMLINCAGMAICGRFEEVSQEDIRNLMNINYFGTALPTKYVLPGMKSRKEGVIVFVSTEAALLGIYGYSAYGATKWAVRGLAEALFMELLHTGVTLTVSFPPDTDTPGFATENASKPLETKLISESGGIHTAEEVAQTMISDALSGKYYSVVGSSGWMLKTLFCSSIESVGQLLLQFCLMGPLRLVLASYALSFNRIIKKCLQEKEKPISDVGDNEFEEKKTL